MAKVVLALLMVACFAPIVGQAGQIIYVNGSGAPYADPQSNPWGVGSDSNPGTMAGPLATIGAAAARIHEQAVTVVIAPATYSGNGNQLVLPGFAVITFRAADPQAKPIINASGVGFHWFASAGIWIGWNSPQARIENIVVKDVTHWGSAGIAMLADRVTLDGVEVSGAAYRTLDISGATNFQITNCKFLAPRPGASGHVCLSGPASGTISACVIDADNNANCAINNGAYGAVVITRSVITGGGSVGITQNSSMVDLTVDSVTCFGNGMRSIDRFCIENLNSGGVLRVSNSIINSGSALDPVHRTLYQADVDYANQKNVNPHFRSYKAATGIVTISFDDNGDMDRWNAYTAAASARGVHLTLLIHERTWKEIGRDDSQLVAWKNAGHDVATHTYSHSYYDVVGEAAIGLAYEGHGHNVTARIEQGHLVTEVDGHEDLNFDLAQYTGYETNPPKHIYDLVADINRDHDYHAVFNPAGLNGLAHYLKATSLADMAPTDIEDDMAYITVDGDRFFRDEIGDVTDWLEATLGGGYKVVSVAAPATVMTDEAKAYMIDSTAIEVCRGAQTNSQDDILLRNVDLYQLYSVPTTATLGDRSEGEIKQAARAIAAAAVEQGGIYGVFGHSSEFTSGEQLGWFIDGLKEFVPKGLKILSMREASAFIRNPANGWTDHGDGIFSRTFIDNSNYGIEASSPVDSFPQVDYLTRRSSSGLPISEVRTDDFIPGQVIARFAPGAVDLPEGVTSGTIDHIQDPNLWQLADEFGLVSINRMYRDASHDESQIVSRIGEAVTLSNVWDVYLLEFPASRDTWTIVDSLRHIPCCIYSEPNALLTPCLVPCDSLFGLQWNLARINMASAWDLQTGSTSVRIGVLDTGIDYMNPAFGAASGPGSKIEGGWDYVDNDSSFLDDACGVYDSHGTLAAGIIGAYTNNIDGIAGIAGGWAPLNGGCALYALKVADASGAFRLDAVCNAIREAWPRYRVEILNAGFGGYDYYESLREALGDAHRTGVVFAAAKGNDGSCDAHFPSDFDRDWVISVGASNDRVDDPPSGHERRLCTDDGYAWSSNYGNDVDVLAPGAAIESAARTAGPQLCRVADGTSMATAHVSGLAGLVLSEKPGLCADDVEGMINASAKDMRTDAEGGEDLAGYDPWSGHGRIIADSVLTFLRWPFVYEHYTATGGHALSSTGYIDLAFAGDGPLSGRYFGKRYDVRCNVGYPAGDIVVRHAWGRGLGASTGWSAATPNYQMGFARVVEGTETETGCEMQSHVYEVWTSEGTYLGWHPCRPEQVVFAYTVLGRPEAEAGLAPDGGGAATEPHLYGATENPCRDHTVIAFDLPRTQDASLRIYDVRGREVGSLFGGIAEAGRHRLVWNGRDLDGHRLAPGIYLCHLETTGASLTTKIVLVR